jgi:hypothetical protein
MALDIEKAKAAGYSDAELVDFLAKDSSLDVGKARKVGYSDTELLKHLSQPTAPKTTEAETAPTPVAAPLTTAPITATAPTQPAAAPVKPEEDSWWQGTIADKPLKLGAGLVTGVRMIADAMGADSEASKNLRGVEDYIAALYSAGSKKDSQEIARIMRDAEDKGVGDQVLAGMKAFYVAPVDLMVNALGTSAPAIVGGVLATLAAAPTAVATGLGLGIGAVMGAGTIKGSIYEATKQILSEKTELSPKEIEARAVKAQEYGGKNLDQILIGTGLGMFGAASGIEPALARQLAKGIASTAAQKEAVALATRKATEEAAKRGVIKHGAITGGKEFVGEGLEGGQEQLAQNIAQQREGFDVPTMRGVAGQATMEGLAGLGMGTLGGGREAMKAKREMAEEELAKTGEKFQGQFTTAKEEALRAKVGYTEETAGMLKSIKDASGKDIVANVEEPEIAGAAEKAAEQAAKTKTAEDLITKIDAGEKVTRKDINPVGEALGVKFPPHATNETKIDLIRQHIKGASNVAGSQQSAAGTSTNVAAQPSTNATAEGTTAAKPNGVDATNAIAAQPAGGKAAQPAALTPKVAPETVSHLKELSDKAEALANDGKGRKYNGGRTIDKALTRAIDAYNAFKEQHGINEDELPANYREVGALAAMNKKVYATPRTDEEAVLATEEEEQANYDKNLQESYKGKEST